MIGMIFAQIAPVVDGICVANSMGDEEALAAIATVGPIGYVFNIIAALGGIGCGVLISRCSGSGEKAKAGRIFTRTLLFMVVTSIIGDYICRSPSSHFVCNPRKLYLCQDISGDNPRRVGFYGLKLRRGLYPCK